MSAPIIDSLPLPPHSQEAEHALLGALLANPEAFHYWYQIYKIIQENEESK